MSVCYGPELTGLRYASPRGDMLMLLPDMTDSAVFVQRQCKQPRESACFGQTSNLAGATSLFAVTVSSFGVQRTVSGHGDEIGHGDPSCNGDDGICESSCEARTISATVRMAKAWMRCGDDRLLVYGESTIGKCWLRLSEPAICAVTSHGLSMNILVDR